MGIPVTERVGLLFTASLGFLFTVTLGFQLTASTKGLEPAIGFLETLRDPVRGHERVPFYHSGAIQS